MIKAKEYKLPEVLRKIMKRKKLSQQKLADKIDTTQGCVYSWLSGNALPSLYSLMELSDALDVSIDYLVYGDQND